MNKKLIYICVTAVAAATLFLTFSTNVSADSVDRYLAGALRCSDAVEQCQGASAIGVPTARSLRCEARYLRLATTAASTNSKRAKWLYRYKQLKKKVRKLRKKYNKLSESSNPQKQAKAIKILTRILNLDYQISQLAFKIWPCREESKNKLKLTISNHSDAMVNVYIEDKYGQNTTRFLSAAQPQSEISPVIIYTDLPFNRKKDPIMITFHATYPDGTELPKEGITDKIIKSFWVKGVNKRKPCIKYRSFVLSNSDFSSSGQIPPQEEEEKSSIEITNCVYNGNVKNNAPGNDLTIHFSGNPIWPVDAVIYPTYCPTGINCGTVHTTFYASSVSASNTLIWHGILWCKGFPETLPLASEVVLTDANGAKSKPYGINTQCVVDK
jgi:hypothetical protein